MMATSNSSNLALLSRRVWQRSGERLAGKPTSLRSVVWMLSPSLDARPYADRHTRRIGKGVAAERVQGSGFGVQVCTLATGYLLLTSDFRPLPSAYRLRVQCRAVKRRLFTILSA